MKPNERLPLAVLNNMLATVQDRKAKALEKVERYTLREGELLILIADTRDAMQAEMDQAAASIKKGAK